MSDNIWVALIGLLGSGAGSLIGVLTSGKLIQYRLEQLEKKVDKHNHVIERVFALEERAAVHETKQRVTDHRLEDLEKRGG